MVAMTCAVAFLIVATLMATGRMAAFDTWGLQLWRDGSDAPLRIHEAVRDITALGGTLLRNLFGLAGIAALLMLGLRRQAAWLFITIVSAWLANGIAKTVFARARPDIVPHWMEVTGNSFPSGHSFGGAVVFWSLALAFAALSARQPIRTSLLAGALIVSLAIAWSRVWLGVHYPSDVIAGWLGGTAWAFAAAAFIPHQPLAHVP